MKDNNVSLTITIWLQPENPINAGRIHQWQLNFCKPCGRLLKLCQ